MDLDEYFFYEKKKNKRFSATDFAKKVGVTKFWLNNVAKRRTVPGPKLAYLIHKESNGMVDVWQMIVDYYDNETNDK